MPIRTTVTLVKEVLGGDYDGKRNLTPFMRSASALVDDIVTYADDEGLAMPDAERLTLIETWLAAHDYSLSDRPLQSKSTGGRSGSFQGQTGKYFEASHYGMRAVSMDPTGYLSLLMTEGTTLRSTGKVSGMWLGKRPSEERPYIDRT